MDSWRTRRQPLWMAVVQAVIWSAITVARAFLLADDSDVTDLEVLVAVVPAVLAGLFWGDVLIPRPEDSPSE